MTTGGPDGDLFTGTDDAAGGQDVFENDQPPLVGSDGVALMDFIHDLTYREVHAFTVGFVPLFLGLFLMPFTPAISTAFLGLAVLLTSAAIVDRHRPSKPLRYIVKEPHYYLGGELLAALFGVLWVGLVGIFGTLVGVVL
jgi:hypothetical protein